MTIVPLGDQAALIYLEKEEGAGQMAAAVRARQPDWLVDVVQAYKSVAIYFNLDQIHFSQVAEFLQTEISLSEVIQTATIHTIPCCYEFQLDLPRIAQQTGLDTEAIIQLHSQTQYTIYAIGFCPGFPYLGYLPASLQGVSRLESPRLRVDAGSVGLTGSQTGIYTEERPGGWNIIGRTPLQLVDVANEYFPLRTGDKVRFRRVDEREYRDLEGERL